MQLIYIYDHAFAVADNKIYSTGAFSVESWRRYLTAFDSVLVVAHLVEVSADQLSNLNRVDCDGVTFKFVPKLRGANFLASVLQPQYSTIANVVREADAIAVRQFSNLGCTAVALAKRYRKSYAIEIVDCPYDGYRSHSNPVGVLFAPLARFRLRRLVLNAPFVCYVTSETLQARYPSRGYTQAASNVTIDEVISASELAIRQSRESPSLFKIGIIGHYASGIKGQAIALEALSRLSSGNTEFRLELVGSGSNGELLQCARKFSVGERTLFHGQLKSGTPVMDFLDSLDLYIHPSYKEGLPRAVIEAMSRGLPVLASKAGGTPELLNSQYLHVAGDVDTLTRQISEMLSDKNYRDQAAYQNVVAASRYVKELLDERREKFWRRFAAHIPSVVCNTND